MKFPLVCVGIIMRYLQINKLLMFWFRAAATAAAAAILAVAVFFHSSSLDVVVLEFLFSFTFIHSIPSICLLVKSSFDGSFTLQSRALMHVYIVDVHLLLLLLFDFFLFALFWNGAQQQQHLSYHVVAVFRSPSLALSTSPHNNHEAKLNLYTLHDEISSINCALRYREPLKEIALIVYDYWDEEQKMLIELKAI